MRDDYFWHTLKVRWGDMDAFGHVNNACYFTYFESARMDYLGYTGLWRKENIEEGPILVAESMNFRKQVFADEVLEIGVRISEARHRSFVMETLMLDHTGTKVADGSCVLAWIDYARQVSITIPEKVRALVKKI